ncbi:hypothetical protein AH04_231 [Erwinia phage AH04]|uniref:Uncharacterized protein n=1 Tax=Erwinia phage AH04 TaxID=2869569 RepID=A0AAE7X124_9CAUD|nr:hypothetical protein PQC02_gp083 [Erwinia phage AH04]QZA70705.1 hypothetical protein AH04_231 [Erwinia phage AH04]
MIGKKVLYTCDGKGGSYELVGVAEGGIVVNKRHNYVELGKSTGAGLSRGESINVFRSKLGGISFTVTDTAQYVPFTPKVVYKDTITGKLFHRESEDFATRMLLVAE